MNILPLPVSRNFRWDLDAIPSTNPVKYSLKWPTNVMTSHAAYKEYLEKNHQAVVDSYKKFYSFLGWMWNESTSSSDGYRTYNYSFYFNRPNYIHQHATLTVSWIIENGNDVGYEWGLSVIQWEKSGGKTLGHFIKDPNELKEWIRKIESISQMMKSESEREFCINIILNQLKNG